MYVKVIVPTIFPSRNEEEEHKVPGSQGKCRISDGGKW